MNVEFDTTILRDLSKKIEDRWPVIGGYLYPFILATPIAGAFFFIGISEWLGDYTYAIIYWVLAPFLTIILVLSRGFLIRLLSGFIIDPIILLISTIEDLNLSISKKNIDFSSIDNVLNICIDLYNLTSKIIYIRRFKVYLPLMLDSDGMSLLSKFLQDEGTWIHDTLIKLKYILSGLIREHCNHLQDTKIEISETMKSTDNLIHIAESQKVRLDRQIKQFEELQRVLVKI